MSIFTELMRRWRTNPAQWLAQFGSRTPEQVERWVDENPIGFMFNTEAPMETWDRERFIQGYALVAPETRVYLRTDEDGVPCIAQRVAYKGGTREFEVGIFDEKHLVKATREFFEMEFCVESIEMKDDMAGAYAWLRNYAESAWMSRPVRHRLRVIRGGRSGG